MTENTSSGLSPLDTPGPRSPLDELREANINCWQNLIAYDPPSKEELRLMVDELRAERDLWEEGGK